MLPTLFISKPKIQYYGSYCCTHDEHALHVSGCHILDFSRCNLDLCEKVSCYHRRIIGWNPVFYSRLRLFLPVSGHEKRGRHSTVWISLMVKHGVTDSQFRMDMALA